MLDPQATMVQELIGALLLQRQFLAARFLRRHQDLHLRECKCQEAQILQQPTPGGQGIRRRVGNGLIMDAAAVSVAQKEDEEQGIHEQDIFDGVILFLTAITPRLFNRVLGADDAPLGPVMGKRGDAGAAAGIAATGAGSSASGVTTVAASASETPSRCARAVRERREHHRGCATPRGGLEAGHESIDWLCSGPYRTGVPAPPGGCMFSGRSGEMSLSRLNGKRLQSL